jgi:hypothetical protein
MSEGSEVEINVGPLSLICMKNEKKIFLDYDKT